MINLIIINDELKADIPDNEKLKFNSDSVGYYEFFLDYQTSDWAGLDKYIVFDNSIDTPILIDITDKTSCFIPHEVLEQPQPIRIGMFATNNNETTPIKIITNWIQAKVDEGCYTVGTVPNTPTPDIWEQYIHQMQALWQDIDAEMSSTSTNAVQNKAIKKYVDGIRETIIVNTPPFTIQPTIEGSLNSGFKPWNEDYYYVHKIDDSSFTLMPNKDDASNAIGQIFTLSGLNTGNSGTLIENDPIDFLTTGASFSMRKAGVRSFSFSKLNCNQIEFYGNGYCNSSGYFLIDTINGFNSYDFNYFGTAGKYIGSQGFIMGTSELNKVKNVQNNFNLKLNANKKHLNCIYNIHNYRCDDVDKTKIISQKNIAGNGSGFKTDLSDIAQVFTSMNINISYPSIFRNGFELNVFKRSV